MRAKVPQCEDTSGRSVPAMECLKRAVRKRSPPRAGHCIKGAGGQLIDVTDQMTPLALRLQVDSCTMENIQYIT